MKNLFLSIHSRNLTNYKEDNNIAKFIEFICRLSMAAMSVVLCSFSSYLLKSGFSIIYLFVVIIALIITLEYLTEFISQIVCYYSSQVTISSKRVNLIIHILDILTFILLLIGFIVF